MMLALVARTIANDSSVDCQSNLEYDKLIKLSCQLRQFSEMKTTTSCFLGKASRLINRFGKVPYELFLHDGKGCGAC